MEIFLCRHGETEWTRSGRHTSHTDISLTEIGKNQSILLGKRLPPCDLVLTSPLKRSRETCQLAHLKGEICPDATEWDYGQYEGLTHDQIDPLWNLFTEGAPGGETPAQVATRADRLVKKLRAHHGNAILFSHGHFLRVLAARWLGLKPEQGWFFFLSVASLSILGFEHDRPVIKLWNDTSHLTEQ
ncbi:MAG: histidine phosphatase family protein [Verrucomicrobiota bacterium]|nr:histidine phosphatase family protein [Verrucomicrobiota bacterium]